MQNIAYYPINIVKGDSFELVFNWKIKDCSTGELTPVNLTAVSSVESKLLNELNEELVEFTASVTDATEGEVTISLTDTQTASLSGSVAVKPVEVIGRYYVRLIYGNGKKKTILRGKASLTSLEGA